ncbi:MAG: oligosaccharide flippase family protein [Bacteroidaceae bacterium]|nr:oligosaccharide flippase family protein [Bacteroidaceae bacterium]
MKQGSDKKNSSVSYTHVLKFTGIFGGVQGLKLVVSLIRNKLSSILLGTTGFGLLGVYSSITEFITNCCNCGIPLNTTQKVSELYENGTPEEMRDFVRIVRTWVVWTAVAALLLSVLLSPLVSYLFFHKEWSHIGEVILLTPVVVAYLVAGGECSLLKGQRQLRSVATIESIVAVTTLLSTVPFYYYWGLDGIIFALIFSTLISAVVHLYFSVRIMPYRITPFSMDVLRKGWPFVRRGLPYVVSGIATSAATMAVPIIILNSGSVDDVGLYRAAFAIMVGYAGMVFVAMEADYYPRLSSVHQHTAEMNRCINQQIDVCVLLVTPLLILLTLCLPFVIRLLYTGEFMSMQTMALLATFYTFFRAIMLPVAYVPLAKGKSMVYLCIELASNLVFCLFIWLGWTAYGLNGIGVALSLVALYDVLVALVVCGRLYGCRLSARTIRLSVVQFMLLAVNVAVCFQPLLWLRLSVGIPLFIVSSIYSFQLLRKRIKRG